MTRYIGIAVTHLICAACAPLWLLVVIVAALVGSCRWSDAFELWWGMTSAEWMYE